MYIIELVIKKFFSGKKSNEQSFNPLEENTSNEIEACEHIFMPIDSTNETLSCTKCGLLVNRKALKNKNFFMN